jgi:hypothetical protein
VECLRETAKNVWKTFGLKGKEGNFHNVELDSEVCF